MSWVFVFLLFLVSCGQHESVNNWYNENSGGNAVEKTREELLLEFAQTGNLEALKAEVAQSLDLNLSYRGGTTLLIEAVRWNQVEIVDYLLQHQVDIDHTDDDGKSAREYASHPRIKLLLDGVDVEELLGEFWNAIDQDRDRDVQSLILQGIDINSLDEFGDSALMRALRSRAMRVITVILRSQQVDLSYRNADGDTALALARKVDNQRAIQILVSLGSPE